LLVSGEADTPDFARAGLRSLRGVLYLSGTRELAGDRLQASNFAVAYRAASGSEPLPVSYLAYDATQLLLRAAASDAKGDRVPTRAGLLQALPRMERLVGASGIVQWGADQPVPLSPIPVLRLGPEGYPGRRDLQ